MNNWIDDIQCALDYMEEKLSEDIKIRDIAEKAFISEFHFQRMFSAVCGISIGEYIRNRRMTLAAKELLTSNIKIIDLAIKYGYDSPDSFSRAFQKFHGITPSLARKTGAKVRDFAPIRITLSLQGGTIMDYKIVKKEAFTIMGRKRRFNTIDCYQRIPEFWDEHYNDGGNEIVCGMFGLCVDSDGNNFDYLIADLYKPWDEIPDGYETRVIQEGLWAVFPCKLSTLQDTNTRMWKEWLPNCKEYKLVGNYDIEMYAPKCKENPGETYVELWLPLEKQ